MAVDTKMLIAKAVRKLLVEKKVKKLTVKDIVEECHITRQSFYYHFEDIPSLLRWILEKGMEEVIQEAQNQNGAEAGLRYFFLVAINAMPYFKKTMQSNYGDEFEKILKQQVYRMFQQVVDRENLYQNSSQFELKLILRYHSQAIWGILEEWTEEDTKNLDRIVHEVYLLMTGGITPF